LTRADEATAQVDVEGELEEIETTLLLEGIRLCYGYDFREYAMGPLRRSILAAMTAAGSSTISAYQDRVLHDPACMQRFLGIVGVNVTSFFRDPDLAQELVAAGFNFAERQPGPRAGIDGIDERHPQIVDEAEGVERFGQLKAACEA